MRELLAETKEARLRRLCGRSRELRHVPSGSVLFLRRLRELYPFPARCPLSPRANDRLKE